jgi:hypothetical protein
MPNDGDLFTVRAALKFSAAMLLVFTLSVYRILHVTPNQSSVVSRRSPSSVPVARRATQATEDWGLSLMTETDA